MDVFQDNRCGDMSNISCQAGVITVACLTLGEAVLTIASMLTVMLIIILGNLLVVFTVYRDRKLRLQRQNWLIVSLALADLLVGLLVMPLTLIYEIVGEWKMGTVLCEMWLALDVLFVTASILHICAISLDRYFSVTSPLTYPVKRTPTRMFIYIGVSWVVSLLICLPPIFGWRPERRAGECTVSTDIGYVLYSSLGSFYIPVIILIIVYAKIYSITIKHSRQRLKETQRRDNTLSLLTAKQSTTKQMVELALLEENSDPNDYDKDSSNHKVGNKEAISQVCWHLRKISEELPHDEKQKKTNFDVIAKRNGVPPKTDKEQASEKRKRKLKAKERQATLLLGIILSAFILSWLPFFVCLNN
uniref:G_PROTEIN_RECEP_F1_2 domain-containing protein n=1 Tax=Heterorhabditis bacteriophora TaxID=37862 RepID=A0A1I7XN57_HETBA